MEYVLLFSLVFFSLEFKVEFRGKVVYEFFKIIFKILCVWDFFKERFLEFIRFLEKGLRRDFLFIE